VNSKNGLAQLLESIIIAESFVGEAEKSISKILPKKGFRRDKEQWWSKIQDELGFIYGAEIELMENMGEYCSELDKVGKLNDAILGACRKFVDSKDVAAQNTKRMVGQYFGRKPNVTIVKAMLRAFVITHWSSYNYVMNNKILEKLEQPFINEFLNKIDSSLESLQWLRTVFVSYVKENDADMLLLTKNISEQLKDANILLWVDRKIRTGDKWHQDIQTKLLSLDVAIILLSQEYLTKDYVCREELPRLNQREEEEGIKVLPILIDDVDLEPYPWIKSLQHTPKDTTLKNVYRQEDEIRAAHYNVIANKIIETMEEITATIDA